MGIEGFGSYIQKYFRDCTSPKKPKNIASLFIDANGIFYKATAKIVPYEATEKEVNKLREMSKEQIEEKIIKAAVKILEDMITQFRPRDNLILAIDGVANAAKMNQQKTRRYKKETDMDKIFNTRCFTPGTNMMVKLDQAFDKVIKKIDNIKRVIYSSHLVPGEAEHKIFDLIRANKIILSRDNHILHGDDGDLLIIPLLSHMKNIYVYRENISLFHNIDKLKELIQNKLKNRAEEQILCQDFAVLSFFIGNDFLPRFPNLPNTVGTMDIMIKVYNRVNRDMTTLAGNIIWDNFYHLLNCMDKWKRNDYGLYENNFIRPLAFPLKILHDSVTLTDEKGKKVKETYDSSRHVINFDLSAFAEKWYNKQFAPKEKKLAQMYSGEEYFTTRDITKMVIKFLQTFQWVLKYYLVGPEKVPNSFFYPYNYTPLSVSVINYLKLLIRDKKVHHLDKVLEMKNYPFHAAHQLLMVLPPFSIDLIPSEFHTVYKTALNALSPTDYPDPIAENTDKEHMAKPIIPPINPLLTFNACQDYNLPAHLQSVSTLIINNQIDKNNLSTTDDFTINETILM